MTRMSGKNSTLVNGQFFMFRNQKSEYDTYYSYCLVLLLLLSEKKFQKSH